ncbi:MAG: hypothetical protein ABIQ04_04740 [Candidatus Saccharimonadales bacterium]
MHKKPLDLTRLNETIHRNMAYVGALPHDRLFDMDEDERRSVRRKALAASAIYLAKRHEAERGPYDLDSHLYQLIGQTEGFYQAQCDLDSFRYENREINWRNIPETKIEDFEQNRKMVTAYNHTVHEIINAGASKFGFNELANFMTNIHVNGGGSSSAEHFHQLAVSTVIGMRTEISVEQILIDRGIEYDLGSEAQDIKGGDIIIAGIGLDLKTSELSAKNAKEIARKRGHNPDRIIWAGIQSEDYEGKLILPSDKYDRVAAHLLPAIETAIGSDAMSRVS